MFSSSVIISNTKLRTQIEVRETIFQKDCAGLLSELVSVTEMAGADNVAHDIQSILSSSGRDYLVRNNGDQVQIESLKGKKVGLYFSGSWCGPCRRFTPTLVELYNEVSPKGDFEIIFVSADEDEDSFNGYFSKMPWLAVPFSDSDTRSSLDELFQVQGIPHLVILDENGKVATEDGTEAINEHGVAAYPFTAQTLESILVSGDLDFVLGKDGVKIPVSDLVGKTVLLYFSAQWCPPCRAFLPKLIEAYHKIKAKDNALEVVFISSDRDQASFDKFFAEMPWLALPFGDSRKAFLGRKFKVQGIPMLVAIGPSGRTITKEARGLITLYGDEAYPFTEERVKELEAAAEERRALEGREI
ncbi:probable nucleoredoxin 1 [Prosopis cineraria]|uniref:probable nucleoredoxin 1 n=1 Tax=Prosopis cineraria TaxID=364024 RepID=UPI00240F6FB5|nr:probable nucleoredoxin 1 [Prosopis cineraria]